MKKRTIAGICLASVVVIAGGGYGINKVVRSNASPVAVQTVSSLNTGWWGGSMPTSGIITANASQEVYLDGEQLIDKVHVKEGDKVKIGDKLLSYDTTLLDLDLESEKLEKKSLELQIKAAEQELEKLKTITPVADSDDGGNSDGYYDDGSDLDDGTDLGGEARGKDAVLISNKTILTATSEIELPVDDQEETPSEPQKDSTDSTGGTEGKEQTGDLEPETDDTVIEGDDGTGESEKSPLDEIKAYKKLKYNSKPYKGTGTKEDPYLFFCKDGVIIEASFMNKLLGFNEAGTSKKNGGMREDGTGSYAILEIREGDSVSGGFVKSISINGTIKADKPYEPDVTWTFTSEGVTKNVPEVDEPTNDDINDWDDDLFGDGDNGFDDDVYTVTELKEAIKEKEDSIKDFKLDVKEAELKVKQAQRKVNEAHVNATINGVVKVVGDPAIGEIDGESFMTVTSNEGLYVQGTISELKLGKVKVGSTMTGMSYESGSSFSAEITEISEFPSTSDNSGYDDGSSNASQYPFMAYIADSNGLSNNEYVELTIQEDSSVSTSAIYLYKAYIRSENGQSYVYKADETNHLVKQYIKTGATVYSTAIEIQAGLSLEDSIAFPYGKNVVEGAKVTTQDDDVADMDVGF